MDFLINCSRLIFKNNLNKLKIRNWLTLLDLDKIRWWLRVWKFVMVKLLKKFRTSWGTDLLHHQ